MIKGAIIHMVGELPIVADLAVIPRPVDVSLLCSNVRTIDGKRPSYIEHHDWLMVIPLATVRLLELPSSALSAVVAAAGTAPAASINGNGHSPHGFEPVAEPPAPALPEPAPTTESPEAEPSELVPDEDLLRRIREA